MRDYESPSSLSTWLSCPAKYFFSYVLHGTGYKETTTSIHLHFGSATHAAVADFHIHKDTIKALDVFTEFYLNPTEQVTGINDIRGKTLNDGLQMLELCLPVMSEVHLKGISLTPELEKRKKLGSTWEILGRCDGLSNNILFELKTTSRTNQHYLNTLTLDMQLLIYCWLFDRTNVLVLMMVAKKEPELIPGYGKFSPRQISNTMEFLRETITSIRNNTELFNAGDVDFSHMIFPKTGVLCKQGWCNFKVLCTQDCQIQDVIVPETIFKRKTVVGESVK